MHDQLIPIIRLIDQLHRNKRVIGIPRSPILSIVAIEDLLPAVLSAGIDPPVAADDRRKVQDDEQVVGGVAALTAVTYHAFAAMLEVDPLKAEDIELVLV